MTLVRSSKDFVSKHTVFHSHKTGRAHGGQHESLGKDNCFHQLEIQFFHILASVNFNMDLRQEQDALSFEDYDIHTEYILLTSYE